MESLQFLLPAIYAKETKTIDSGFHTIIEGCIWKICIYAVSALNYVWLKVNIWIQLRQIHLS